MNDRFDSGRGKPAAPRRTSSRPDQRQARVSDAPIVRRETPRRTPVTPSAPPHRDDSAQRSIEAATPRRPYEDADSMDDAVQVGKLLARVSELETKAREMESRARAAESHTQELERAVEVRVTELERAIAEARHQRRREAILEQELRQANSKIAALEAQMCAGDAGTATGVGRESIPPRLSGERERLDAGAEAIRSRLQDTDKAISIALDVLAELERREQSAAEQRSHSLGATRRALEQICGLKRTVSGVAQVLVDVTALNDASSSDKGR